MAEKKERTRRVGHKGQEERKQRVLEELQVVKQGWKWRSRMGRQSLSDQQILGNEMGVHLELDLEGD